jgi:hypothetical protein
MVKRKYTDEEELDAHPQPAVKRIAIRTELGVEGQMDVDMDDMPTVETPSEDSSSFYTGAYPPTSQSLYPFPVKRDDMECDDSVSASSPESSSPVLSKSASDPIHANVVDNRHPSNASSINALQPRTRSTSCACPQIPKLILAQYTNEQGKRTMWSHCEGCGAMDMVLGCNGEPVCC